MRWARGQAMIASACNLTKPLTSVTILPCTYKWSKLAMFETLTNKLQAVFDKLSKHGLLTEEDVDVALREVRLALLEADVHYAVTKDFLGRVRARAVGAEVRQSLSPAQQVVKIVH